MYSLWLFETCSDAWCDKAHIRKYYFHSMRLLSRKHTASLLQRSVIFTEIIAGYSGTKSKPNSVGEMPHYLTLTHVVHIATSTEV